jgi:hypothetical protein
MSGAITIKVRAKTAHDLHRVITVSRDGLSVKCDCDGFDGTICSHVDAVLLARERAMVLPAHWQAADAASDLISGKLVAPLTWRGAWRRNIAWRGLTGLTQRKLPERDSDRPLVCFTGKLDRSRAKRHGWDTVNSPSRFTDVLVCADPSGTSAKLEAARQNNTPIVSPEEWAEMMLDGALPE